MAAAMQSQQHSPCTDKPIDLVHLAKQTMGDRDLEVEVLGLFLSQSASYLNEFLQAKDWEARKRAAHKIKGSAKGLGAWELANAAERAETQEAENSESLETALCQVADYIKELQN